MSKSFVRSIKNVTNGYTPSQVKVRNATSNDAWGPSTGDMEEICHLTHESHEFFQIMDILDKRMNDKGKNWRHVLKSLTVFEYILYSGSEYVVHWGKHNLYIIKTLREFQYIDDEGVDQGASIRGKAKELTELLQNDEKLREVRANGRRRKGRRNHRRGTGDRDRHRDDYEAASNSRRRRPQPGDDDYNSDFEKALEESRLTAEEEERRRKQTGGSDEDLRRAIALSKEEERHNYGSGQNNSDLFSQPNLIDTDFSQQQQAQQYQQQYYVQQQPVQTDLFGNPIYQQQPLSTGVLQNAYATGATYQPVGFQQQQQQQQQQLYYQPTGYEQQQALYYQQQAEAQAQAQTQAQAQAQQPLQPLKTGSNNPFAKLNDQPTSSVPVNNGPSLNQIQGQQQQQQQHDQLNNLRRRPSRGNFDDQHLEELNNLLQNGTGLDTFGNYGDLRIPAQHTLGNMVNSTGINLADKTGADAQQRSNPFLTQQYTGIATTSQIQPAYTGYGFGNAAQSQQTYQRRDTPGAKNSLIDI